MDLARNATAALQADWLDVRHESLVSDFEQEMKRIF